MLSPRYKQDDKIEVGIDEAGRGCFWGPLIAGAVIWPNENEWTDEIRIVSSQIKDSKRLSPKRRAQIFEEIKKHAVSWAVGSVEASEIDSLGMSHSNRLAFQRAIDSLSVRGERFIIDGVLKLDIEEEQIVEPKADGKYLAVAAASIVAKEWHDNIVRTACTNNEELQSKYGLNSCRGYGTSIHSKGILEYGMDTQHRRLFLRNLLGAEVHNKYKFIE